jgi:transglutaminase-like putative cysteine protease
MKYRLCHTTTYAYESTVSHSRHLVRKRPRALPQQAVLRSILQTEPRATWSQPSRDYFANEVDTIELGEPHDHFVVTATSEVAVNAAPLDSSAPPLVVSWEEVALRLPKDPSCFRAREMLFDSPMIRRSSTLADLARQAFTPGRPLLEATLALNHLINKTFVYDPSATDVATPLEQVMRHKRGVCQDFAHVAIGALRSIGLAARYVSGYLETLPPPGKPRLVGADASHAWLALFVPDEGWVAIDPTNNSVPSEQHIVVAWGRDFGDVSPLRGVVLGGGRHTVTVGVDVERQPEPGSAGGSIAPRSVFPEAPQGPRVPR